MRVYPRLAILTLCLISSLSFSNTMNFKLKMLPEWEKYSDIFESPASLLLLFESIGAVPSYAGKFNIVDATKVTLRRQVEIPFGEAQIRFVKKEGARYDYDIVLVWKFLGGEWPLKIGVSLDLKELAHSSAALEVRINNKLLPTSFKDAIEAKITSLADKGHQESALAQLAAMGENGLAKNTMLSFFIADYNKRQIIRPVKTEQLSSESPDSMTGALLGALFGYLSVLIAAMVLVFVKKRCPTLVFGRARR